MRPQGCSTHSCCIALTPAALHPGASTPNAAQTLLRSCSEEPWPFSSSPRQILPPSHQVHPSCITSHCAGLLCAVTKLLHLIKELLSNRCFCFFCLVQPGSECQNHPGLGDSLRAPQQCWEHRGAAGNSHSLMAQPLSLLAVGPPGKKLFKSKTSVRLHRASPRSGAQQHCWGMYRCPKGRVPNSLRERCITPSTTTG